MIVYISGWGTDCSTLWQPRLPVSATEGATGLPGFTWKMAIKTVYVVNGEDVRIVHMARCQVYLGYFIPSSYHMLTS